MFEQNVGALEYSRSLPLNAITFFHSVLAKSIPAFQKEVLKHRNTKLVVGGMGVEYKAPNIMLTTSAKEPEPASQNVDSSCWRHKE